ncbi:MAG: hypothetical protein JNK11_12120 [Alphaproteobacteria bacterium]|nr:hypothetical protein [Alphaproteobacteria bacterium]
MIRRTAKACLSFVAVTLIGAVCSAGLVVWRLSDGPLSIAFLAPIVEDALGAAGEGGMRFAVADTSAVWNKPTKRLELHARDVQMIAGGRQLAVIPDMVVGFSRRALLRGEIAVSRVEAVGLAVDIAIGSDGRIDLGIGPTGAAPGKVVGGRADELLALARSARDGSGPLAYLDELVLRDAGLVLRDERSGLSWTARGVHAHAARGGDRMIGTFRADVDAPGGGEPIALEAKATVGADMNAVTAAVAVEGVRPESFAAILPQAPWLQRIRMPVAARAEAVVAGGRFQRLALAVEGAAGQILAASAGGTTLAVERVRAALSLDGANAEALWHAPATGLGALADLAGSAQGTLAIGTDADAPRLTFEVRRDAASGAIRASAALTPIEPRRLADRVHDWIPAGAASAGLDRAAAVVHLPVGVTASALLAAGPPGRGSAASASDLWQAAAVEEADVELSLGAGDLAPIDVLASPTPVLDGLVRLWLREGGARAGIGLAQLRTGTAANGADGLVTVTGDVAPDASGRLVSLQAQVQDMSADRLRALWPVLPNDGSRTWTVQNTRDGQVPWATAIVTATAPLGAEGGVAALAADIATASITQVDAYAAVEGLTVTYLPTLPPVRGTAAHLRVTMSDVEFRITDGEMRGARISGGTVAISGIDKPLQALKLDVEVNGPLRETLEVLDMPPFRYPSKIALDPARASGRIGGRLRVAFPLSKTLTMAEVGIEADLALHDASVGGVAFGRDVTALDGTLRIDTRRLRLAGTAAVAGIASTVAWTETFDVPRAGERTRIEAKATLGEADRLRLGLPELAPWLSGPTPTTAVLTVSPAGAARADIELDLGPAQMRIPQLRWSKEPGIAGRATLVAELGVAGLKAIPSIAVETAGAKPLAATGRIAFDASGSATAARIERFRADATRLRSVAVELPEGQGAARRRLAIDVDADTIDLGPALETPPAGAPKRQGLLAGIDLQPALPWPLAVELRADRVLFGPERELSAARLRLQHDGTLWQRATLDGAAKGSGAVALAFERGRKPHAVTLTAADAGGLFRLLDLTDDIEGGALRLDASLAPATGPDPSVERLSGRLDMSDYRMRNAPFFAKLLSIASLTGIVEQLGGGLPFTSLRADLSFANRRLEIKRGQTHSTSLGLTMEGMVNLEHDLVDLRGTLAPFSFLGRAIDWIPLLGTLLTGGDGKGIFAATFRISGPLAQPDIGVNPLAALTPGFMREIFGVFDGAPDAEPADRSKPRPAPPPAPDSNSRQ